MTQDNKYDVVIVGAGLVGSICALLLARSNFKILLLDSNPPLLKQFGPDEMSILKPELRMSAITLKSQDILEEINVWQSLQCRLGLMQKVVAWEEQGTAEIILDCQLIGKTRLATIIENNYLLQVVNTKVKESENIFVLRPCKINNIFTNKNTNVSEIEVIDAQFSVDNKIRFFADLIVGADGASSWIRDYFNFDIQTENYNHTALVTNVRTLKNHNNIAYQKFLREGPLAFLPWAKPNICSIVWSQSEHQARLMQNCSEAEFSLALEKAIDGKLGKIVELDKRITFPLVSRHVNNYYKSGVVLVGDAAHTIHPLAGQGLNLGIYDAYELSKIVETAKKNNKSINSDSTLNKYQLVRKGHNQQLLNLMSILKEVYNYDNQNNKPISLLRNLGVTLTNNISFIKKQITRFAAGYY